MWTEEQFNNWRASEETKEFMAFLTEVRESLKERWARGVPIDDKEHAIAMVYGDILNLTYWGDHGPGVSAFYEIEQPVKDDDENDGY